MELKGKTAIVTGGSLGIGATIAIELAREGANVAINYRKHDTEAKEVAKKIEKLGRKCLVVKADVTSSNDAETMFKKVIKKFGGAIPNLGDNYSGNIILRFGNTIVRILTLCGSSNEISLDKEITGNGSDKLNVLLQNPSSVQKTFAFWYDAYERE